MEENTLQPGAEGEIKPQKTKTKSSAKKNFKKTAKKTATKKQLLRKHC